ncbi:hypothetical protein [Paraburkholderia sp. GAS42]|jgi:hypothetical protein|uniref:hypothetical protein n=1 Tax=Paraburkholderia sp. GAS42 TaxID=3035135 RepID=UPI003D225F44
MKTVIENLDYPHINALPEYRAETDKLGRFHAELAKCETRNVELHAAWMAEQESKSQQTDAERIAAAERLLDGKPVLDLPDQIKQNMTLADSLRRAISSQSLVVRDLAYDLSRKAAERFEAEHKNRVKRVADALIELHTATQSEIGLHDFIDSLGYSQKLPAMRFAPPGCGLDPQDQTGGYAPAWYRDAIEYVMTDEERQAKADNAAADGRRRKLAALT